MNAKISGFDICVKAVIICYYIVFMIVPKLRAHLNNLYMREFWN